MPTNQEVLALLRHLDQDRSLVARRDEVLVLLLLNGLRISEALNAKWDDLVDDGKALRLIGKGKKERVVPLTERARDAMNAWHAYFELGSVPFIVGILREREAQRIVARRGREAGITGLHPHALRHNYLTRLADAGVDVWALGKLAGHSSVKTTQRYIHLNHRRIQEAAEKDPLFR
jgi:integrase